MTWQRTAMAFPLPGPLPQVGEGEIQQTVRGWPDIALRQLASHEFANRQAWVRQEKPMARGGLNHRPKTNLKQMEADIQPQATNGCIALSTQLF